MSLAIRQNLTYIAPGVPTVFEAYGGTSPYTYEVVAGGAGGSITSGGIYTAPLSPNTYPSPNSDTILVTDNAGATSTAEISIGTPLELVCDIIRRVMGLGTDQVWMYNQKIKIPEDSRLYVAVGVLACKPFANGSRIDGSGAGLDSVQSTNFQATLSLDIFSRNMSALYRKEEMLMALKSPYSTRQQEANSFKVFSIPTNFVNLSAVDGAAIPYHFSVNVNCQYFVRQTIVEDYFNEFSLDDILTDP